MLKRNLCKFFKILNKIINAKLNQKSDRTPASLGAIEILYRRQNCLSNIGKQSTPKRRQSFIYVSTQIETTKVKIFIN